jgi:hypothetical protein
MKIRNCPCAENIKLFYFKVKFVILPCIYKCNYQNNPTEFPKDIHVMWKRPSYPQSKGKRENDQGAKQ